MTGDALWTSSDAYDRYVGRWSRRVTEGFLAWAGAPRGATWLDVGCGTGALCEAILATEHPAAIHAIDPSISFAAAARAHLPGHRVAIAVGTAVSMPLQASSIDVAVSGLVFNFVPDPDAGAAELARVLRPGGVAALYIWDYAGEMQMMRHFWDAAIALFPAARALDEAARCTICRPDLLHALLENAGFTDIETRHFDVPTLFTSFDDYWQPFLAARAPAPAFAMSLREEERARLRAEIARRLPTHPDGSIALVARALAVKGRAP